MAKQTDYSGLQGRSFLVITVHDSNGTLLVKLTFKPKWNMKGTYNVGLMGQACHNL